MPKEEDSHANRPFRSMYACLPFLEYGSLHHRWKMKAKKTESWYGTKTPFQKS